MAEERFSDSVERDAQQMKEAASDTARTGRSAIRSGKKSASMLKGHRGHKPGSSHNGKRGTQGNRNIDRPANRNCKSSGKQQDAGGIPKGNGSGKSLYSGGKSDSSASGKMKSAAKHIVKKAVKSIAKPTHAVVGISIAIVLIIVVFICVIFTAIGLYSADIDMSNLPQSISEEMVRAAVESQEMHHVPASVTLGQIIQESTGSYEGLSLLAYKYYNLFGIKGTGPAGSVNLSTGEETASGNVTVKAGFRVYHNHRECVLDHGEILNKPLYTNLTAGWTSPEEYITAVAKKWATDSSYAEKVIYQMQKYDLYRFDGLTLEELENGMSSLSGNVSSGVAGEIGTDKRLSWLFPGGTPTSASQMRKYLTTITVPIKDASGHSSTMKLTVHKQLKNEIMAVFNEMYAMGFPVRAKDTCGYNWRTMASGTGKISHHSFGCVVDLNWTSNGASYTSWGYNPGTDPYSVTPAVVSVWKRHGFYWGGDWSVKYFDPMHFTYTNH